MGAVSTKRVLIVGDRPEVAAVVAELLTRSGYQVQRASHSTAASFVLAEATDAFPDIAILDANRLLGSSFSVMQFIRNTMCGRLPVIVLATGAAEEHEQEFQRLGASRLLWKPVAAAELLSAVAEAAG